MFKKLNQFMFGNVGKVIKKIAQILAWIGIAVSVLLGIVTLTFITADTWYFIFVAPLVVCVGWLISWLSSITMYGFGELVDRVIGIEINTRGNNVENSPNTINPTSETPVISRRAKQLKVLLDQGLITQEEYQEAMSREQ